MVAVALIVLQLLVGIGRPSVAAPSSSVALSKGAWRIYDVRAFGAKGDNHTKDTAAIKAAIEAATTAGGGEIVLPAPGQYLTGPLNLSSNQLLRVEPGASLLASQDVADYPEVASFPSYEGSRDVPNSTCRYGAVVGAVGATNVSITGGGLLDGQGWHFWALKDASVHAPGTLKCSRPHLVEFEHSADVSLTGLTLQNSPFWTTHFIYSRRIRVSELTILAPATRGNTDGINPDSSTDVIIENVYISNGDDGIAIKSGLNAAGIAVGLPSANIFIRNVTTDGRGGIAIGSEMSGGVKNVTIQDVRLLGQRGIHMKTTRGRGGYIENITMINATARAGIQLWSTYGATVKKKKKNGRWPQVGNITVVNTSSACSLGCGRLPPAYCDPNTFFFTNACGHHGPPMPPPPPAPQLKLAPCLAAGAVAQEWLMVDDAGVTSGFIVGKAAVGAPAVCVDVGGCSKAAGKPAVHTFPVQLAMQQPSKCGNANLRFTAKGKLLVNDFSGLCLVAAAAAGGTLSQAGCDAKSDAQSWTVSPNSTIKNGGQCLTLVAPSDNDRETAAVRTWMALAHAVAALPKPVATAKTAAFRLDPGFVMAGYNGTAITIPAGCVVSITSRAAGGGVLDAGAKGSLFVAGGALVLNGVTLKNGLVTEGNGGVLTIDNGGSANFTSCSFINNTAPNGDGGVVHVHPTGSAAFTSCRFVDNTAGAGGGAVDVYKGSVRFVNCSFAEDSAGTELKYNGVYNGGNVTFGCPVGTTGADVPLRGNANTSQLPPAKNIVSCH